MDSKKTTPSYYAVITAPVRYDPKLSDSEKLLYGEITAFTGKGAECWASTQWFADLYNVDDRTIQRRLFSLVRAGYIKVYKKGRKRYIKVLNV